MPTTKVKDCNRRRCVRACIHCKRRKERCDGQSPCQRCIERGVSNTCRFTETPPTPFSAGHEQPPVSTLESDAQQSDKAASADDQQRQEDISISFESISQMIQDDRGTFLFFGDSSNRCFLQSVRSIVSKLFDHSTFVNDQLHFSTTEERPETARASFREASKLPPPALAVDELDYCLKWYHHATDCLVNLFDPEDTYRDVAQWAKDPAGFSDARIAVFELIIAIGAQAGPEDYELLAEQHFSYGRYLTLITLMDHTNLVTTQCNVLLATYLITSSRLNAAFTHVGVAARNAYALGLHRRESARRHKAVDYVARERLWRAIRIMDLFMCVSLGRPPATYETRDTTSAELYSASNALCWIFEVIISEIYNSNTVTTASLDRISDLQRKWSSQFVNGLQMDGIRPDDMLSHNINPTPNIGMLHLKEAYHWTIILLSWPFLVEHVTGTLEHGSPGSSSQLVLVQACIHSASCTADLVRPLVAAAAVPKRLPFVVNSSYVAALVLSLALIADLEDESVVSRGLCGCINVLQMFSKYDTVAAEYLSVTNSLHKLCESAMEARRKRKMEFQRRSISQLFGSIHGDVSESELAEKGLTQTRPNETPARGAQRSPIVSTSTTLELMDGLVGPATTAKRTFDSNFESLEDCTLDHIGVNDNIGHSPELGEALSKDFMLSEDFVAPFENDGAFQNLDFLNLNSNFMDFIY